MFKNKIIAFFDVFHIFFNFPSLGMLKVFLFTLETPRQTASDPKSAGETERGN